MATRKERRAQQICNSCNGTFLQSLTQCPHCGNFQEKEISGDPDDDGTLDLDTVEKAATELIQTGPWDPCFGCRYDDDGKLEIGVPADGVSLIGGVPGAGKSTLALQLADSLAVSRKRHVIIFVYEEGKGQVKARADRLKLKSRGTGLIRIVPMGRTIDLDRIIETRNPCAIIGDSLQKMFPDPVDQVEFCEQIKVKAVERLMPVLLISHVNKDEELAGLQALQHAVDTTLLFDVDTDKVRILTVIKNRYGDDSQKVLFDMTNDGLVYREPDEEDNEDE